MYIYIYILKAGCELEVSPKPVITSSHYFNLYNHHYCSVTM